MKNKIYTIGSFSGWRDKVGANLSDAYEFDDPRNHSQSSIARLVTDDMSSAMNCPISLIYTPDGKRAGTMSYAELGASWASGNTIISVDENYDREELVREVSQLSTDNFGDATRFLNGNKFYKRAGKLKVRDRTESKEPYREVLFTGGPCQEGILRKVLSTGRRTIINPEPRYFEPVSEDVDLIVTNFQKGHDKTGLFYMGVGYALKIPVIMVEGNSVPYPPLLGLSRRVMVGEKRFEQLDYYLENLESQHIAEEAKVYYNLMKKFD